ncbi:transcriptional regulator [Pseudoalteromonas sp. BSi20652]|uniref:FMN-binding negative transcriptional regulator n=1 Tax=Pseudoalteromonas sp. BSi20652 TaxID=388384 RepID=UPI000231A61A|nr:FMN-binding negative transcriptional regulator [Pseudoalteromonas sp. BSi20652]GAA59553.1 transcriptional regulator [Pseudoalteromonas sp. BSi20652]
MYPPTHFQEHNIKQLHALVKQFPLATILMPNDKSDSSNLNNVCQMPVLFDEDRNIFIAHVAKHNPLAQLNTKPVKLLFNGDNCYLSPSYSNNKTLPSWLYSSVQVTANINIIESDNEKDKIMQQLTSHFEQGFTPMWSINDLPKNHREAMYQQLSFIEITPTHWQGNFKLSQNKPTEVRSIIKHNLTLINKHTIAALF